MKSLPDRIGEKCRLLFVGINPGLKSARVGHHYAGNSNRFWKLLHRGGFSDRLLQWSEDVLLPSCGIGLTNIVGRPTRGSAELNRTDFENGTRRLAAKVRRHRPRVVAFVGVTAFREFFLKKGAVRCGLQEETIAHFTDRRMLRCFFELRRWIGRMRPRSLSLD